jgi:D-alanyl-D-alanine dipeptidase
MNLLISLILMGIQMAAANPDFVSLKEFCPDIIINSDYATPDNFTGHIVRGYKARNAYMARVPAEALKRVQTNAIKKGYTLIIFDSYRPVKAVTYFQEWAKKPETNPDIQAMYYPNYTRQELFDLGYIASKSSHSRGSAVDLGLVNLKTGKELDMGTRFDFFDDLSHTASPNISANQKHNRMLLKELMEAQGFTNFSQEWWHFSFKPEPYPGQYFDFDVD